MAKAKNTGRLSAAERASLLQTSRITAPVTVQVRPSQVVVERDVSFETLPGYKTIQIQKQAADILGLSNPFYRKHQARAGARSVVDGRGILNFASYDYLGLNGHPRITEAVCAAAREWGTSVSASRLTAGERDCHRQFEARLAEIYGMQDCLVHVSGHATNVSTIGSLMGPKDLIVHDSLAHNSIVVGAHQSGAHRIVFAHNDIESLAEILNQHRDRYERCLIVTEGLFSMDGDGPDLAGLIELKTRFGAWLMIDEAHSLGVLGATGRGLAERQGIDPAQVDIWMGTLSKTLVSCGGYIAGPAALIEYLRFNSPGMVYSVGLPVPATVAAMTALEIMFDEPDRIRRLQANGKRFLDGAKARGLDTGTSWGLAITPLILGDSLRAVMLADRLFRRGINAFPIIPPGVPEKSARLRFFISASHEPSDIDAAVDAVAEEFETLSAEGISVETVARQMR
ncbi:aminotransferase class I/II-fold pyridoxal phosphate-dependent enzyme [Rhizobium sp. FY34]|uniref:aminotransferase class I/II-fold pyridoxal phosphate-dependent enzyme n=1 Tax=Rhizobium sp. FY34 TaxID=2562309 RepID=UPI0010C0B80B|nr:aminotransferase class I/II-fold pyridoxal phosphate-dependent enzyme [Rhizobium sp. FY34]